MSFIVYLTETDWTADDGGTLQLYPVEGQAQDSSKTFGVPTAHPTAEVRCLPPLQPVPQQRRRRCLPPSACQCAFGSAAAAVCCDILLWPRAGVDLYLYARSLPLRVLLPPDWMHCRRCSPSSTRWRYSQCNPAGATTPCRRSMLIGHHGSRFKAGAQQIPSSVCPDS